MELHQLEYFRTLAHIKHFTNASKAIAVSQPALSRSIAKLESELGVQLFDRSDKQLELTAEGKKFLFYVEKGLHQLDLGRRTIPPPPRITASSAFPLSNLWEDILCPISFVPFERSIPIFPFP